MRYGVGVDIGGTKIRAALVGEDGGVLVKRDVPTDPEVGADAAGDAVQLILAEEGPRGEAIGAAVAGFVEQPSGRIAFAPNLRYSNPDIGRELGHRFTLAVVVQNDANAAAWAEHRCGAGRNVKNVLMVTVGTGVGGGAIVDGRLYTGSRGFAAEFGHIPVMKDGPRCACGASGCLEALASGTALGRAARERVNDHPDSLVLQLAEGHVEKVTGAIVGQAAISGDPFAKQLVQEVGTWLGVGLTGLAQAFDPGRIVVGGGVAEVGPLFLDAAIEEMNRRFMGQVAPPDVVPASLGNDAGVVGAALLGLKV
ncbi:MAG TPA: ROK family protein [Actinomycetota bacterium]|nr:ROK family protein [Actinomycetota bacterium]